MNCPACNNVSLLMMERQGVEIDYCPTCRGVWLDRGELDKIIERSASEGRPAVERRPVETFPPRYDGQHDRTYDKHHDEGHGQYQQHRKKSFLSDLFD
jgi:Zn-finger nucleic acid-binding protein